MAGNGAAASSAARNHRKRQKLLKEKEERKKLRIRNYTPPRATRNEYWKPPAPTVPLSPVFEQAVRQSEDLRNLKNEIDQKYRTVLEMSAECMEYSDKILSDVEIFRASGVRVTIAPPSPPSTNLGKTTTSKNQTEGEKKSRSEELKMNKESIPEEEKIYVIVLPEEDPPADLPPTKKVDNVMCSIATQTSPVVSRKIIEVTSSRRVTVENKVEHNRVSKQFPSARSSSILSRSPSIPSGSSSISSGSSSIPSGSSSISSGPSSIPSGSSSIPEMLTAIRQRATHALEHVADKIIDNCHTSLKYDRLRNGVSPYTKRQLSYRCRICRLSLAKIVEKNDQLFITVCNHTFCKTCLDKHILKSKNCPTCRRFFNPETIYCSPLVP